MPPMSRNFVFVSILVYLVVFIFSFVSLLNRNFETIAKNKDLENKILESQLQFKEQEIQYLKRQIHPHFLFNTLNTIYGFALQQSKQTPEIILKFSNLLDYILYQIHKPKVSLKEEILHVQEYIALEEIRFRDRLSINLDFDDIQEEQQIAPMIFLPFVENAFKHGSLINGVLEVNANLHLKENTMNFLIKNTSIEDKENTNNHGIGLSNIKKRLALNYENNHQLSIEQKDNWFTVQLIISDLN